MQITNEDLLKEISERELLELSDFEGTGEIDEGVVEDSVNDALAFITSFIRIPPNPSALLKDIGVKLTIIELKRRNNFPREALDEQIERYEKLLAKMAAGKIPTDDQTTDAPALRSRAFAHEGEKMDLERING